MKPALQHRFLIAAFLAMLLAVPVTQSVCELRNGERPRVLELFARAPSPTNLRAFEKMLENSSAVARPVREIVQALQFIWLRDGGEKVLIGRDGWLFFQPGVSAITQRPEAGESSAREAVKAVVHFRDQLAARGIKLIVFVAPNKESVYPGRLRRGAAAPARITNPDTRTFLERCTADGVDVVDLFGLFRAERSRTNAPLYLRTDTHWSPNGMKLTVAEIAKRISGRGDASFQTKFVPTAHEGDLVRMLQNRVIEWEVNTESVVCERVLAADGKTPYRDDPASDVLVLGDSFLRVFDEDERWRGGFIAQLARELGQPVASIVMDGGGATLVRQELARRPQLLAGKKFVVWEFSERDLRLAQEGWQNVPLPEVAR